ncbi:hypothetical protein STEG23_037719, partial [Scotinomys teguina]
TAEGQILVSLFKIKSSRIGITMMVVTLGDLEEKQYRIGRSEAPRSFPGNLRISFTFGGGSGGTGTQGSPRALQLPLEVDLGAPEPEEAPETFSCLWRWIWGHRNPRKPQRPSAAFGGGSGGTGTRGSPRDLQLPLEVDLGAPEPEEAPETFSCLWRWIWGHRNPRKPQRPSAAFGGGSGGTGTRGSPRDLQLPLEVDLRAPEPEEAPETFSCLWLLHYN